MSLFLLAAGMVGAGVRVSAERFQFILKGMEDLEKHGQRR